MDCIALVVVCKETMLKEEHGKDGRQMLISALLLHEGC